MKNEKRKLPERWAKSKLFELAEYINGKAFKPEEWEKEGTPIIRIENLTDKKAPFNYYRDECEEKYKIVDGDLLVSWSATLDAFIWQRGSAYLNQHIFKVVPSENKVNKFFLYFLLRYSMKKLRENIHGSTMQHITKPKFDNFEVIHPKDIDDQIRVANELERKMAEIEKMRQAALSQKEAFAAMQGAILREVFPYKEGDKLPGGWRWERLGDIAQLKNGINFSSSDVGRGILTLDVFNMYTESVYPMLDKLYRVNTNITEDYILKENDILFVRSSVKKEGVGWSTVFKGYSEPVCFCGFLIRARSIKPNILPRYIVYYFRENSVREKFISVSGQSTITNINQDNLKKIFIPLPPTLDDQIRIANELERKMAETEKMRQAADNQLEAIEALPGAILRVAFDFKEEGAS